MNNFLEILNIRMGILLFLCCFLFLALIYLFNGYLLPFELPYLWNKYLHILSATLLISNPVIVGIFQFFCMASKNSAIKKYAFIVPPWMDVIITVPFGLLTALFGSMMLKEVGGFATYPWAYQGFLLYFLSFIIWVVTVIPVQEYLAVLVHSTDGIFNEKYTKKFWGYFFLYSFVGALSMAPFYLMLYLMIFKQPFSFLPLPN